VPDVVDDPNTGGPLDLLILGSGVAGLSAAVRAADSRLRVGVLTKGALEQATTRWAQGGIAAVLDDDPDASELHVADTLAAGGGLCDPDAVRVLVDEGPGRVKELIELGATFDRDPHGALAVTLEGGHSQARVVHAGGAATGLEVERALVTAVRQRVAALYEGWFACDLLVERGRCVGITAFPPPVSVARAGDGRHDRGPVSIRARHVLLATGGAGQLFAVTTNPAAATGDGIAMALRAGAAVADLEFVQFHPTALHHPVRPRPLLSEALRGHGAVLRDASGERFVDELLPRDEVSRAITERMLAAQVDHLWLDATPVGHFDQRFPSIAVVLSEAGFDPARHWLPVAPAAHYVCGGAVADLDGASSLPGLWVAGEAACGGVHGANRLASNSLLDGMVFGARVVEAIERGKDTPEPSGTMRDIFGGTDSSAIRLDVDGVAGELGTASSGSGRDLAALRARLQQAMTRHAGVVRSAESLEQASAMAIEVEETAMRIAARVPDSERRAHQELLNMTAIGRAMCAAALERRETRGAHTRRDHPKTRDDLRRRFVIWSGASA
jgi:L-aspartate oxidase